MWSLSNGRGLTCAINRLLWKSVVLCDFQGWVIRVMVATPVLSLGSLMLRKDKHCVGRTLKQPCGGHMGRNYSPSSTATPTGQPQE